jgi:hypothetical protein
LEKQNERKEKLKMVMLNVYRADNSSETIKADSRDAALNILDDIREGYSPLVGWNNAPVVEWRISILPTKNNE